MRSSANDGLFDPIDIWRRLRRGRPWSKGRKESARFGGAGAETEAFLGGHRINSIDLFLSLAYLAWALAVGEFVEAG
jgi:hypothetical protein